MLPFLAPSSSSSALEIRGDHPTRDSGEARGETKGMGLRLGEESETANSQNHAALGALRKEEDSLTRGTLSAEIVVEMDL